MRGFIAIGFILVIVLFQNCGTGSPDGSLELQEAEEVSTKVPMGKMDRPQSITIHPELNPLEINLTTGEVKVFSPRSPLVGKCLSKLELDSVNDVLNDLEICEIYNKIPENVNCSMALIPSYAHLKSSDGKSTVELGAATNGCREFTMDLCERSETLQAWVKGIELDSMFEDCP